MGTKKRKKWPLAVIGVFIVMLIIGACSDDKATDNDSLNEDAASIEKSNEQFQEIVEDDVDNAEQANKQATQANTQDNFTMAQKNAMKQARNYIDFTAFSYEGLIKQLEYEGYSKEDATFAVENISVDWNEQAAIKAQDYLDYSSFSRQGLIDQLLYEGFTSEQAEYGVSVVGY